MRLHTLLLTLVLATVASVANAGRYFPLQQGHWGNWHDPARVGEGIELAVHDNPSRSISGEVFLLGPDGSPWWAAIAGEQQDSWRPDCADYELTLYQRSAPNGEPFEVGTAWIKTVGQDRLRVIVYANYGGMWLREGAYIRPTPPPGVPYVGVCDWPPLWAPRPGAAPLSWCHHEAPVVPVPQACPY